MNTNYKDLELIIRQSLLNSLFIHYGEVAIYKKAELEAIFPNLKEFLHLNDVENIMMLENNFLLGIKRFSKTFQHEYIDHYYSLTKNELSFSEWISDLVKHIDMDDNQKNIFLERVFTSQQTIKNEFHENFYSKNSPQDFQTTETQLYFGHYAHPYSKLRETKESLAFDFNSSVLIKWLFVKKEIVAIEASQLFTLERALIEINELAKICHISPPINFIPFPMHPFQWLSLKDTVLKEYIDSEQIMDSGCTQEMTATTSTRSLYDKQSKWMLKFSLSLRLTNSIRHLKPHEVRRGIVLHEATAVLLKNNEDQNLRILHEPFFCALKNSKHELIEETITVFRENPFFSKSTDNDQTSEYCLAVLTQPIPNSSETILTKRLNKRKQNIERWYIEEFLEKVIFPILKVQSKSGILLGAHQQNLILKINNDNTISKCFYRDTQGTGFLNGSNALQELNEKITNNFISKEMANTLVGYYLIINTVFGTIRALCNTKKDDNEEDRLFEATKIFLKNSKHKLKESDTNFLDYLMQSPYIKIKNNFICCLKNINENSMTDPLSIYTILTNPLYNEDT